jgi:fluoride exporter
VSLQAALLVFLGGGTGALLRYAAGLLVALMGGTQFPWATIGVNVLGSLLIGFLAQTVPAAEAGGASMRLLLITGVLGGFTTFSAFSLDVLLLSERGENGLAFAYIALSVTASLGAAALGWSAGRLI